MSRSYNIIALQVMMFRESSLSPWTTLPRTRNSSRSPLPDVSSKYSACVGSILSVNNILSERGLQHSDNLPPGVTSAQLITPDSPTTITRGFLHSPSNSVENISSPGMANVVKKKVAHFQKQPIGKDEKEVNITSEEDSKLVELVSFPGYDPHSPTPLPFKLDPVEQLRRVSRAQAMLYLKCKGFKETWKKLLYSTASQTIFQDYYWWFFLHTFQRHRLSTVQDQLFNRISCNYVTLLGEDIDPRWRDPFFKVYPDLIAQGVYSTFMHAYPASWSSFDEFFKTDLVNYISLWQVGTKPIANVWKKWELGTLEPANRLKKIGKDNLPEKGLRKRTPFELDTLVNELERKEQLETCQAVCDDVSKNEPVEVESNKISFDNFEDKLASSMDQLQITRSKEKIIRTQLAQATQSQLKGVVTEDSKPNAESQGHKNMLKVPKTPPLQSSQYQHSKRVENSKQDQGKSGDKSAGIQAIKPKPGPQSKMSIQKSSLPKLKEHTSDQSAQSKLSPGSNKLVLKVMERCASFKKIASRSFNKKPASKCPVKLAPSLSNRNITTNSNSTTTANTSVPAGSSTSQKSDQTKTNPKQGRQPSAIHERMKIPNTEDSVPGPTITERKNERDKKNSHLMIDRAIVLVNQKRKLECNEPVPIEGVKFAHAQFDIYGQSPLVKHYLKERALSRNNEAKVLVGRTELVERPGSSPAICYQQILEEARQKGRKNYVQFEKHYRQQRKAIAESQLRRLQATRHHEQDVKRLLSNKREVTNLSNEIASHIFSKGEDRNETINSAMKASLLRVSKP